MRGLAIVPVVLAVFASPAFAGALVPNPEGVYIDPEGVLRTRVIEAGERLDDLRRAARRGGAQADLTYVSLPRLFAAARERIEAGEALPDDIRFVGGLVELRYIFVYPEEGDLVIAGPSEPVVADFPGRPVGGVTGRPLLQLDDLVVALRTCGPGRPQEPFGCTIELGQERAETMFDLLHRNNSTIILEPDRRREIADQMVEAAGMSPVVVYNLADRTRFAMVTIEADYILKRHALALDRTATPTIRSYLERLTDASRAIHRFWFELRFDPLRQSSDGRAYELRGPSIRVSTRRSFNEEDREPALAAAEYSETMSQRMERLCESILPFADLSNLADLALLAAVMEADDIDARIGWDLGWVMDEYPVAEVDTPRTAVPLVNYRINDNTLYYAAGGVRFTPSDFVRERAIDESPDWTAPERPRDDWRRVEPR